MTIAACHLSPEGVILGADSTTTFVRGSGGEIGPPHHYNYAQKIFEFGDPESTAGLVLWGLGVVGDKSYRTLIAEIADEAVRRKQGSLDEVAQLAGSMFWDEYTSAFKELLDSVRELLLKGEERTQEEQARLADLEGRLSGGFCGRAMGNQPASEGL